MTTIKYTVTNYSGIGEFPKVILMYRPAGSFQHQFYSIIDGLGNWNGEKFDYNKLITL